MCIVHVPSRKHMAMIVTDKGYCFVQLAMSLVTTHYSEAIKYKFYQPLQLKCAGNMIVVHYSLVKMTR